jgi:hypothetical protein
MESVSGGGTSKLVDSSIGQPLAASAPIRSAQRSDLSIFSQILDGNGVGADDINEVEAEEPRDNNSALDQFVQEMQSSQSRESSALRVATPPCALPTGEERVSGVKRSRPDGDSSSPVAKQFRFDQPEPLVDSEEVQEESEAEAESMESDSSDADGDVPLRAAASPKPLRKTRPRAQEPTQNELHTILSLSLAAKAYTLRTAAQYCTRTYTFGMDDYLFEQKPRDEVVAVVLQEEVPPLLARLYVAFLEVMRRKGTPSNLTVHQVKNLIERARRHVYVCNGTNIASTSSWFL